MQQRNNGDGGATSANSNGQQSKQKKLFPMFAGPPKKKPSSSDEPDASKLDSSGAASDTAMQPLSLSSDPVGIKEPAAKAKGKAKAAASSKRSSSDRTASSPAKKGTSNGTRKSKKIQSLEGEVTGPSAVNDANALASTSASTSTDPSALRPVTPPPPQPEVIEITDSPIRELAPIKTFDDFKAERDAKKAIKQAGGWLGGALPLWPSRETIHVGIADAPRRSSEAAHSSIWKDLKGKGRAVEETDLRQGSELDKLLQKERRTILQRLASNAANDQQLSSTQSASSQDQFPIFTRLRQQQTQQSQDSESQLWSDKYAPARAAEVLGQTNSGHAHFLKRWLQELTIRDPMVQGDDRSFGSSKRKIQREVSSKERKRRRKNEKRKKRKGGGGNLSYDDDLDDFIASDSEDEYRHYEYFDLKDDDTIPSPTKSTTSTSSANASNNTRIENLSNVILLCGDVGSGKTSTVYAVAKELGWQVFEVYPGIGKRGSKDIDKYVGMVGQNHIVKKESTTAAASTNGLAGIFQRKKQEKQQAIDLDQDEQNDNNKPATKDTSSTDKLASASSSIAQSVVLIEEVDLLYPSDQGFWEGVISFISKSKRPVILTCNDALSIPFDLLPLQATLWSETLSSDIAVPFLHQVASAEGLDLTPADVSKLCSSLSSQPRASHIDLRKSLLQLQAIGAEARLLKSVPSEPSQGAEANASSNIRDVSRVAEDLSYADAELERRTFMYIEEEETTPNDADDEPNEHIQKTCKSLPKLVFEQFERPLPCYAREAEFAEYVGYPGSTIAIDDISEKSHAYSSNLYFLLGNALDDYDIPMRSRSVFCDTLPYLRAIVASEDVQEVLYHETLAEQREDAILDTRVRRSRRLAEAGKEKFPRHAGLDGEVAECIRKSAFAAADLL